MSLILESGLEQQQSRSHNEVWLSCLIHCRAGFWGCTKASDANLSGHEISALGMEVAGFHKCKREPVKSFRGHFFFLQDQSGYTQLFQKRLGEPVKKTVENQTVKKRVSRAWELCRPLGAILFHPLDFTKEAVGNSGNGSLGNGNSGLAGCSWEKHLGLLMKVGPSAPLPPNFELFSCLQRPFLFFPACICIAL